jgi:hypothetical protein
MRHTCSSMARSDAGTPYGTRGARFRPHADTLEGEFADVAVAAAAAGTSLHRAGSPRHRDLGAARAAVAGSSACSKVRCSPHVLRPSILPTTPALRVVISFRSPRHCDDARKASRPGSGRCGWARVLSSERRPSEKLPRPVALFSVLRCLGGVLSRSIAICAGSEQFLCLEKKER